MPACLQAQGSLYTLSKHFTSENGLPQNSVKAIGKDDYGFIWLATEAGLVRYDGRNFKLYDKQLSGDPFNRIYLIINLGTANNMAALAEADKVYYLREGRVFKTNNTKDSYNASKLYKTSFEFYPFRWSYEKNNYTGNIARFFEGKSKAVDVDSRGLVTWYNKDTAAAFVFFKEHVSYTDYFYINSRLYHVNSKNTGDIQLVTPAGNSAAKISGDVTGLKKGGAVLYYNPGTQQQFFLLDNKLYYIEEITQGHLHTELLIDGIDLKKELIHAAYYDKKNRKILLGSMTNGLFVYDKKLFQTHTVISDDPKDNVIYSQINMGNGRVLAGNGIVFDINKGYSFRMLQSNDVQKKEYSWSIFQGPDNNIWVSNAGSLFHYHAKGQLINEYKGFKADKMELADSNRLWVVGNGKSNEILRVAGNGTKLEKELFFSFNENIATILQVGDSLWVGTVGGLYKANIRTRKIEQLTTFNKMTIRFLKYDKKEDIIWIGTYEDGFYCYRNGVTMKMPLDPNKYLRSVHSIQKDNHGCFWISTNNGLFQIPENDLLAYMKNATGNVFYLYYNSENGFLSNEFNGGDNITSLRLADTLLSFSSMKGLVVFNPEKIENVLPDNELILDEVQVDDSVMNTETDVLTVKRGFKRIRFSLATAYLGNPNNLLYEYKLNDTEWAPMSNETIEFNDLPSEKHTLYFRKASGFGNTYLYKNVEINILPFWWETTLFRVAAFLCLCLFIWLAVYFRIRNLRKRNEELQRQVALRTIGLKEVNTTLEKSRNELQEQLEFQRIFNESLSHEVKTPLKYLTTFIRQLKDAKNNGINPNEEDLGLIYTTSNEIYKYTSNLTAEVKEKFELGNSHSVNIRQLIEKNCMLFQVAADTKNICFCNYIEPSVEIQSNKAILEKIIHNLIDNSVKYTLKGKIIFNAAKENGVLTIEIKDTGIGMHNNIINEYNKYFSAGEDEKNMTGIHYGLGFRNIKKALIWINATLELSATPGGTVCTLKIKDGNLYNG